MVLCFKAIAKNNKEKDEDDSKYHPIKIYGSDKVKSTDIKREINSIVNPDFRSPKTRENDTVDVDVISSDIVASTSNVGASVGMLDLPDDSDGIFEIRTMPYISIKKYSTVETMYQETIDAYGGMGE
jgi:hypothetical protein